jgi:hypothetical protein
MEAFLRSISPSAPAPQYRDPLDFQLRQALTNIRPPHPISLSGMAKDAGLGFLNLMDAAAGERDVTVKDALAVPLAGGAAGLLTGPSRGALTAGLPRLPPKEWSDLLKSASQMAGDWQMKLADLPGSPEGAMWFDPDKLALLKRAFPSQDDLEAQVMAAAARSPLAQQVKAAQEPSTDNVMAIGPSLTPMPPHIPRTPGLPDTPDARFARAHEQNYNPGWFHGTSSREDFREFDPTRTRIPEEQGAVFLSNQPYQAGAFTGGRRARILPMMVRGTPDEIATVDLKEIAGRPLLFTSRITGEAIDAAKQAGKGAVIIKNMLDSGSQPHNVTGEIPWQMAVLDPSRLRSKFAMFDPAAQGSWDIMAANPGSAGFLAEALAARQRASDAARAQAIADQERQAAQDQNWL